MGLYIKGMRMPESCGTCFVGNRTICKNGCPLVALPDKHGDLIDRDEVRNAVFHHLSIKGEENLLPAEKSVFGNIIKAKAVIEAEGEG